MQSSSRVLLCLVLVLKLGVSGRAAEEFFEIRVIDDQTGRGVPLVELETVNNIRYVTDSNGYVALNEPTLFGQKVFFHVRSHGYEFPKDGFGYRGKAVAVAPGGSTTLKIKLLNIAERLYRVTGGGIYHDSLLLGHEAPIEHPLLNAKVLGSDSVVNTIYKGKIHWFWGDTNRPAYPLGNFDVPGAVSELPAQGGLDPGAGVDLSYIVGDDGFARPTAKMPGDGPTWIDGLVTVPNHDGQERMFAAFVKIKPPLTTYARGLAEWNDETQRFEKVADFEVEAPLLPGGHPVKHTEDGVEYVYFARPYPLTRVKATAESLANLDEYEGFTCLVEGSRLNDPKLDRAADGTLRYSWKRNTPPLDPQTQKKLTDSGKMKSDEALLALCDRDTGKTVMAHGGSVYWNEHRQRWVMIFVEGFGSPSFLGEVWYAEADRLVGPWVYTTKIATHDRYDFYNPKQHPMFDADGGRTIFFEGTYTNTFSGNPIKTPRYDYNQVMYKLDLADSRLAMPVAVYQRDDGRFSHIDGSQSDQIAFFALDRAVNGAVPIYATGERGQLTMTRPSGSEDSAVFYALSADAEKPPATTIPLYEFVHSQTSERRYATQGDAPQGFERQETPLCLVWENPLSLNWDLETHR